MDGGPGPVTAPGRAHPDQARFDLAVRVAAPLWRAGCWVRAGLLAGCWGLLLLAPPAAAARGAGSLLVSSLAVGLAFVHSSPSALDRLRRLPGTGRLYDHLTGTQGRATVDVPGLAEGFGSLLALWVFVGPAPVPGLPVAARVAGIALVSCAVWDAVLQAVIDPSWYNAQDPPGRGMRRLRVAIPVIISVLLGAALGPWSSPARTVPVGVWGVLVALPALYYPVWAVTDLALDRAVEQLRAGEVSWRDDLAWQLHSAVKNPLSQIRAHLEQDDPPLEETRSLVRVTGAVVEDLRQQLLAPTRPDGADAVPEPFGALWGVLQRLLPAADRVRSGLTAGSAGVVLPDADRQLLRRVVADLVTNALRHTGGSVTVDLQVLGGELRLAVADEGDGVPAEALADPRSSLRLLRDRLTALGGALTLTPGRVVASWPLHGSGAVTFVPVQTGPPRAGARRGGE